MNFKVSIIVPVYNVEAYLNRCLLSLVNQTIDDLEIIVVNDGSPDNSQNIIDSFQKKYPKKIFPYLKENGGLSDARNFGMKRAHGEYVAFVDSDDYVDTDMYQALYEIAIKEESDIVASNYYLDYEDEIREDKKIKEDSGYNTTITNNPSLLLTSSVYAWNKLYKRSFLEENNFTFPKGQVFEDSAVIYNLLHKAKKISGDSNCYYYYGLEREGSITGSVNENMFDILKSCNQIYSYYKNYIFENRDLYDVIEYISIHHLLVRMRAFVRSSEKELSLLFMKEMYFFLDNYFPDWKTNYYFSTQVKKRKRFLNLVRKERLFKLYLSINKSVRTKIRKIINFILDKKKIKKIRLTSKQLHLLKEIEFEILLEIDKICKAHNISYYLAEGTLLGAIRHNGFIPWDDDVDISMLRDDYNKFLSIVETNLPDHLALVNNRTYKKYHLPFTKIITLKKTNFLNMLDKNLGEYRGPYIDIFPVDFIKEENSLKQQEINRKIRWYRDLLLYKVGYINVRRFSRLKIRFIAKTLSFRYLHNKILELSTCQNNKDSKYLVNYASSYPPSRQIVPKEVYENSRYEIFEGYEFPVPRDAEHLLSTIYGDYLTLPLSHKRVAKHSLMFIENEED